MNWEAISAIGQIVGAFAVVNSLIYLAREVGSNAHATRQAAMRSMLESLNRPGLEAVLRDIITLPGVQAWWRSYSRWFGEEFAKFINQLQQTAHPT